MMSESHTHWVYVLYVYSKVTAPLNIIVELPDAVLCMSEVPVCTRLIDYDGLLLLLICFPFPIGFYFLQL